jgi:hypothetical protein
VTLRHRRRACEPTQRHRQPVGGALALALAGITVLGTATAIVARFTFAAPRDAVIQVQQERLRDGLDTGLAAAVENVRRDAATCTARTVDLGDVDDLGGVRIRVIVSCADLGGGRYRFTSTGYLAQAECAAGGDQRSAAPVLQADVTYLAASRDARDARIERQTLDDGVTRCEEAPFE